MVRERESSLTCLARGAGLSARLFLDLQIYWPGRNAATHLVCSASHTALRATTTFFSNCCPLHSEHRVDALSKHKAPPNGVTLPHFACSLVFKDVHSGDVVQAYFEVRLWLDHTFSFSCSTRKEIWLCLCEQWLSCVRRVSSCDGLFILLKFGYVFRKDVVGLLLFLLTPLWCNSLF